ncbi:glycosyl hydrolase family 18 protein [Curtobacterium sp. 9128]|uniref:glycosyl hydrolase family 18 protein n=1 Tax=Curtobacterium sp. 9128 TaxID=1793722 RepID=UPI00119DBD8A|nr:glycosyl hydrolase family 18 protein [Curtobacterium sp. 9128]
MLRGAGLVAVLAVAGLLLSGCQAERGLRIEAYVEPGGAAAVQRVRDAVPVATTIGIDGVTVTADGSGLDDVPDGLAGLARAAGSGSELLVSNYSAALGDFSPEIGTALLASPAHRDRVARLVAAAADRAGMHGVQIDLESLRPRDRAGLVAFAAAVRSAVHDRLGDDAGVSMAVMASTSAAGFRDTGYDLAALAGPVDRFVLMTYDQHGPWSGPGAIGALPWTSRVVRAAVAQGLRADRIDLGIASYGYAWGPGAGDAPVAPAAARRLAAGAARWSDRDGEWSATLDDGRELHWSDARSYRVRTALAQELGLHGVAMWSLGSMPLPH